MNRRMTLGAAPVLAAGRFFSCSGGTAKVAAPPQPRAEIEKLARRRAKSFGRHAGRLWPTGRDTWKDIGPYTALITRNRHVQRRVDRQIRREKAKPRRIGTWVLPSTCGRGQRRYPAVQDIAQGRNSLLGQGRRRELDRGNQGT
jgi:hypothetical protein